MTSMQFEQLLAIHGNSIYGFCCHLTGNATTAEDLYQDSMLKAFGMLERIDCNGTDGFRQARNYIIGIAIRLHKNYRRKKIFTSVSFFSENENYIGDLSSDTDIEAQHERAELYGELRQAIDHLPDKLRIVVYMFYFLEMGIKDIAEELKIPQGTAKSRLNRARTLIKEEMEEIDNE